MLNILIKWKCHYNSDGMIFNRINLLGKCYAQIFDMESFLRGPFGSTSILQYESTKKKSSSVIGDVASSLQFDSL